MRFLHSIRKYKINLYLIKCSTSGDDGMGPDRNLARLKILLLGCQLMRLPVTISSACRLITYCLQCPSIITNPHLSTTLKFPFLLSPCWPFLVKNKTSNVSKQSYLAIGDQIVDRHQCSGLFMMCLLTYHLCMRFHLIVGTYLWGLRSLWFFLRHWGLIDRRSLFVPCTNWVVLVQHNLCYHHFLISTF